MLDLIKNVDKNFIGQQIVSVFHSNFQLHMAKFFFNAVLH
jgi:hypothetical protein